MAWIMLGIAGIFEVVWATFMKLSEGFTKIGWTALTFAGMAVSFVLLAKVTKTLPLGTAYAIWTGIGALGSVLVGNNLFQGAGELLARFLRPDAAGRHSRTEADLGIIFPWQCGSLMV